MTIGDMRIAFKMRIKPGMAAEYKKRHDQIWPDLAQLLRDAGVSDYSIFLDADTNTLFAVQETEGNNSQTLGSHPIVQKWWAYMADIMETNADNSPISSPLTQVFHLD